jgi:hypothetical protein
LTFEPKKSIYLAVQPVRAAARTRPTATQIKGFAFLLPSVHLKINKETTQICVYF